MSTAYKTTFTVSGTGDFPFDMLRYDSCFPSTSDDAVELFEGLRHRDREFFAQPRTVRLTKTHAGKVPNLTPDRWSSFVWVLNKDSIVTTKVP